MKTIMSVLLSVLAISSAKADSIAGEPSEAQIVRRNVRVRQALLLLLQEGALTLPENQCPQIEPSLLDELRAEGILQSYEGAKPSTICVITQ